MEITIRPGRRFWKYLLPASIASVEALLLLEVDDRDVVGDLRLVTEGEIDPYA